MSDDDKNFAIKFTLSIDKLKVPSNFGKGIDWGCGPQPWTQQEALCDITGDGIPSSRS